MRRFGIIMVILAATVLNTVGAFQAPDLRFTHYTTAEGLPSNCVRAIVQDEEGYMWFGSDGGLVRFDGTAPKVFVPSDREPYDGVYVLSLCRYGRGLLVGTDRMLYRYDPMMESLDPLSLTYAEGLKQKISGNVYDIATDSRGNIWLAVDKQGVFRIEPSDSAKAALDSDKGSANVKDGSNDGNDHMEVWQVTDCFRFPEANDFIGALYVDGNDIVWALSNISGGGLYRYDSSKREFKPFQISDSGNLLKRGALSILADSHGDYWLGTWENGLVKFNPRTGEARSLTPPDRVWDLWHIHSITEYSPTMLLVGSDSGLTLVDIATGETKVYRADELDHNSLSDRFVYPVTKDAEGGIWVGTYYRGVNHVSAGSQRFRSWNHSRFANSVSGNVVGCLAEDYRGDIWLGSADGGLCRYNPDSDTFLTFPLTSSREPENVSALCADDGRLWVGTYSMGVGPLDIATGRWVPVKMDGHTSYSCYAIHKDRQGRIWMGATDVLTQYNPADNVFEPVKQFKAWINGIAEDGKGRLWFATPGDGLHRHDPATGEWVQYTVSQAKGSLPNNHIHSMTVDADGELYICTPAGVCRYNTATDRFDTVEGCEVPIQAQSIRRSGDDLWVATSAGLLRITADGQRLYSVADGLSDSQFLPGASLQTHDGKLYFGTAHGFSRVDPMQMQGKSAAPVVKFTGLDIVNCPVSVGDAHLPVSLNDIDKLVLTHADHTFSVYFSALSYGRPDANAYRYRLEGFDKTWLDAGKENRATYSNLPPGTYTLRVKAANSDGVWNDTGVALKIVVKPAWYASALMKALYVILGAALLILAIRLILKRMERAHSDELDRITSNKEKEMFRSKLNFFTIVAHEIRTPVSLIIGPLEKVIESPEASKMSAPVREDLSVIDRNARRLLSLVNQLLDFKKVEDNALPMGFRHERVVPLVESVADRFRPSLEHKGVKLVVDCPDPDLMADIDPEAVTKLVSNLLNNARKFTKDRITVECKPLPDGKRFMISVADNGIGVTKENHDKIFKPFFQVLDNINESKGGTGLGLSIVKSVTDAHGGTIEIDSTPGKGARFIAVLPLAQENVLPSDSAYGGVEEERKEQTVAPEPDANAKPVLLVVDDNEEMLRFVASNFESRYKVLTAMNGKEALDRMRGNTVSMIICDWMMPVMDGVEFLKAIRENENYSHIPFVMLTAKTDNMSKIETMRYGADAYVEKPFSISYLEARIDNLLEMRRKLREKYSHTPLEPITTIATTQVDNELLTRLKELIEEHLANPELNVDFLAEQLGISRSGLYDKIRTLADVTPHELIQLTRLKKAAEYLAEGKYRVQEVSYMVGISNSSYFSRLFQKQFGVRPSEFQK